MQGIDYVAWWGAVVATLVLIWDVAKWFKAGPNVKPRARLNTYYPDSRVLKVEKLENGESKELAAYCHVELVNTGTLPTTIMDISASHTRGANELQMTATNQRFTPHHGNVFPHVLPPGEVWSCRLEMSDLHKLAERGKPFIEVRVSHRPRPIVIWPKGLSAKEGGGAAGHWWGIWSKITAAARHKTPQLPRSQPAD